MDILHAPLVPPPERRKRKMSMQKKQQPLPPIQSAINSNRRFLLVLSSSHFSAQATSIMGGTGRTMSLMGEKRAVGRTPPERRRRSGRRCRSSLCSFVQIARVLVPVVSSPPTPMVLKGKSSCLHHGRHVRVRASKCRRDVAPFLESPSKGGSVYM